MSASAQYLATARLEMEIKIILYMAFFSILSLIAVTLRIASKWKQWARLGMDDAFLVAAFIMMMAMNVLFVVAMTQGGFGQHVSEVSTQQIIFFQKSYLIAGLVMPTCYATAKLSMLWLLHRLFSVTNFRKVIRVLAAIVICWWIATILLGTFICFPIHARWDPSVKGKCSNKLIQIEYFATPIPWIITDFAILVAPLPVLWKTKISRARQIGLVVLFGFGIATCAVACKRYVTLLEIRDDDLTFTMVEPCVWTMIECSTTIICAALPGATPALRQILPISKMRRAVEYFEDKFYAWHSTATEGRDPGRKNIHIIRDVPDSPPANLSTRRLDLTPI